MQSSDDDVEEVGRRGKMAPSFDRQEELRMKNGVKIVPQIYGLFGDDKFMLKLCQSCQKKWKELAKHMKAYHVWNAEEF